MSETRKDKAMSAMTTLERRQWEGMVKRSFHPAQWWANDDDKFDSIGRNEGRIMYVYKRTESPDNPYDVGFFAPNGVWCRESSCQTSEEAARRVNWLNGGKG